MAYVELNLSNTIPDSVRTIIRRGVEPLLQDVHWMLAAIIAEPTDTAPRRQLQVPVAHVLLATVAGVSAKLLHAPGKNTGARFKECVSRFFPWDIDPPVGTSNDEAAKTLYEVFRNPLVHSLGLNGAGAPVVKIGQVFRATTDAEGRVEELERLTVKPYSTPCLVVTPKERVLWLDPFYWGVRKLVERWARDADEVSHASRKLATHPKR
jgi:hypothetical protein